MLRLTLCVLIHNCENDGPWEGPLHDRIKLPLHQVYEHRDMRVCTTVDTVKVDTETQLVPCEEQSGESE